jgi:hypothetical protein
MNLHRGFSPKIEGNWYAYYVEGGERRTEYVLIKQVADRVSGTITSYKYQQVFEFTGQIKVDTLVPILFK